MKKISARTKNAKLNMISSILLQMITAISGLILPRLIIPTFGSSINGLIATIAQFISYIALLEGGLGSVFKASLYLPLHNNDLNQISGIINEQKEFYRKIGRVFALYIILLCIFFPLLVKTDANKCFVIMLIIIMSISTFIEYYVSLPYQSLIIADQMVRLINFLSCFVIVLNILSTFILIKLGANILIIKVCSCGIAIIKPIVYLYYVKSHYKLDKKAKPSKDSIRQKWNGVVHHLAYYVHRNTDIVLLSVFVGTSIVSVYHVYLAIIAGIERIITSFSSGLSAGIGDMIVSGDKITIEKTVDSFELIQIVVTTILYSVTALMLKPFISLYTKNMVDVNYDQPIFGYVLIIAEAIYCIRCIYSTISINGNKFRETQAGALMEGAVNLIVSLILVLVLDPVESKLLGIAVGTLLGMIIRLVYEIFYLSSDLIYRHIKKAFSIIGIYSIVAVLAIVSCNLLIDYNCDTSLMWFLKAVESVGIVTAETVFITLLFYRQRVEYTAKKAFGYIGR